MGCLVLPQISLLMPPKSLLRVGFGGEGFTPQSPAPVSTLPMGDIFGTTSFTPQNSTPPAPLDHGPFSYSPHSVRWDAPTPKTHIGFPHPREQVGSAAPDGRQELEKGGDRGGQGRPRRRRAQTQCCHSRGRAVGPGPSCPDTIGAAPARHLCALCARQPPTPPPPPLPLLSVPHRIMDPLCVLGWTRTLFRRKKLCLSVRRDRPRKGRGGAVAAAGQRPSPLPAALALRGPRSGIQNPNGVGGKKSSLGSFLSPII